jgi:ankyrin repeat protein
MLVSVTALSAVALDRKMCVVMYLLDHGADQHKKDDAGSIPLHCAAKFGRKNPLCWYLVFSLSILIYWIVAMKR